MRHWKLLATLLFIAGIAVSAPQVIGPIVRPDNRDESTFPTSAPQNRGGLMYGTDAGLLYISPGDGGPWDILSGRSFSGLLPISISSDVISCAQATEIDAGCVTTGLQVWDGAKAFLASADFRSGFTIRGPQLFVDGPNNGLFQQYSVGGSFNFLDNLDGGDPGAGVTFQSLAHRTNGFVIRGANGINQTFANDVAGNVFSGCGYNPDGGSNYCGSFVDGSGISGNLTLTATENFYPFIAGKLPANYCGYHGAVTSGNTHPSPLWLHEFYNPEGNGAADIKAIVNYQGGYAQPAGYSLNQFAPCGNISMCPADGGNLNTDAGYAFEGTLMYAHDEQKWYFCDVPGGVGTGTWLPVDTNTIDGGLAGVTLVTGSGNIASSGGTTPNITFTGTLPVANGGTNLTGAVDDNVMVGNGTTWQTKAIADCDDSVGQHLNYDTATNTFSCGTSSSGGVSSVAVTTANGFSCSVANPTTTPNLTCTLGAITPTTIVASSTISGSNLSGTNSGNVTLASFGSTANANGASLSTQVLTLQPASASFPGGVSTTTQSFAGNKTFTGSVTADTVNAGTSFNTGAMSITDDLTVTTIGPNPVVLPQLLTTIGNRAIEMQSTAANIIASDTSAANASSTVACFELQSISTLDANDLVFGVKNTAGTRLFKVDNEGDTVATGALSASNLSGTNTGDQTITLTGDVTGSGTGSFATTYAGTVPVAKGGTNLTAATDDNVMVGNGTTWQSKALSNCTDTAGQHLNYTASSNTFSCGTSNSANAVTNASWSASAIGVLATSTNFSGGVSTTQGTIQRISCGWTVAGVNGAGTHHVIVRVLQTDTSNATTEICSCTLLKLDQTTAADCNTAASSPLSCACSGSMATPGMYYTVQFKDSTDCTTTPSAMVCNVEYTQ